MNCSLALMAGMPAEARLQTLVAQRLLRVLGKKPGLAKVAYQLPAWTEVRMPAHLPGRAALCTWGLVIRSGVFFSPDLIPPQLASAFAAMHPPISLLSPKVLRLLTDSLIQARRPGEYPRERGPRCLSPGVHLLPACLPTLPLVHL